MISLSFHTIIFQRNEWGRAYDQSLPYTIVVVFFITERRTTESTWSACPSILLYFKEKNEGKLWSVSPLYYYISKKRIFFAYAHCFFQKQKNDGKHMISLSFHTIIFQRKEWGKAMISLSLILLFFQKQKNDVVVFTIIKEKNEGKQKSLP